MRYKHVFVFVLAALLFSCKKERSDIAPNPDPVPVVLLKEINIPNLPSPYYHFEYNAGGKIISASFASGLFNYQVNYAGGRISNMINNVAGNTDTLLYSYNNAGKLSEVKYIDGTGSMFGRVYFTYNGNSLVKLERERKLGNAFVIDKTMAMSYYPDGNLFELTEHRPAVNGQAETNSVLRFEQYDNKINTDAFGIIHNDFFDHLVLLPSAVLQKNNPGKETRLGDGINYVVNYTYTYTDKNAPLEKKGNLLFTNGTNSGTTFQTRSNFSYY
jgi:hypothetical protein